MAYATKYVIHWQGELGGDFYARIKVEGYSGTSKTLTPAATPFAFSESDEDDPTTEMRTLSGHLNVLVDASDVSDILPSSQLSSKTEVTRNGVVIFDGFVNADTLSSDLDQSGLVELRIPVMGMINALELTRWDSTEFGFMNLAKILSFGFGSVDFELVVFVDSKIDLTAHVLSTKIQGETYFDIIRNMLRMQCASLHQFGQYIFIYTTGGGTFYRYTSYDLASIAAGGTPPTSSSYQYSFDYSGNLYSLLQDYSPESEKTAFLSRRGYKLTFPEEEAVASFNVETDKIRDGFEKLDTGAGDPDGRIIGIRGETDQKSLVLVGGAKACNIDLIEEYSAYIALAPKPSIYLPGGSSAKMLIPVATESRFGISISGRMMEVSAGIRRSEEELQVKVWTMTGTSSGTAITLNNIKDDGTSLTDSSEHSDTSYKQTNAYDNIGKSYFYAWGKEYIASSTIVIEIKNTTSKNIYLQDVDAKIVRNISVEERLNIDFNRKNTGVVYAPSSVSKVKDIEEKDMPYLPIGFEGKHGVYGGPYKDVYFTSENNKDTLYFKKSKTTANVYNKNASIMTDSIKTMNIMLPGTKTIHTTVSPQRSYVLIAYSYDTMTELANIKLHQL